MPAQEQAVEKCGLPVRRQRIEIVSGCHDLLRPNENAIVALPELSDQVS
jgi:hypothetical protein